MVAAKRDQLKELQVLSITVSERSNPLSVSVYIWKSHECITPQIFHFISLLIFPLESTDS